jgi:SAM-dependent methyltransferase
MIETFDADWLALREPFDAAARSAALAARLAAVLPARPRILDLGAGTGSLFRWLAPIIDRAQAWTFADADAGLLAHAFAVTADWAEDQGYTVTWPGIAGRRALLVHAPGGAWRVEAVIVDLAAASDALPFSSVDAVVCSALLDLASAQWLTRLVAALRTPLLACLSVDGRDAFLPRHPLDRTVLHAFRRDQGRDKGFGPALGPRAPQVLHAALAARGFTLTSAASDWRIPPAAMAMLDELVQGHARVAAQQLPARRAAIAAWQRARLQQVDRGRLAIRIGHRDSLALPSQE